MRNLKGTLEYDGAAYFGWQRQPRHSTIQQTFEETVERIVGQPVRCHGAGRTDTGVHARGQVASFRVPSRLSSSTLQRALNALLPPDIRVLRLEEAPDSFHARYDCRSKRYVYRVYTGGIRSAFDRAYALHAPAPLDVPSMRVAARPLVGRHDFRSFARKMAPTRSTVRTLLSLDIWEDRNYIFFALEADGFLHTMVRSIVGTLIQVGMAKRDPRELVPILASGDRARAGPPAPPQGLFLMEAHY
jgi:tRNA pseudouridine38-40 synthase